ncbi:M18 family aminopeptidase [Spiribacter halobius]|uniref:M18 family aminopeptidase n=2 Tax=Sediminicurvatus halobius TaxID=2182432 RepID=A0A2U2N0H1_9GAMM|nr:M18 family aminopeptidase [Spiribacter halobius]
MPADPVTDLLTFIDSSPSPWHAGANLAARLGDAGFAERRETDSWDIRPGGRYLVRRDESSLIAVAVGQRPSEGPIRIVGAHTDSPGLRVKPGRAREGDGMQRLGVEVYGGPILATFADRDLTLAGRVILRGADGTDASRLFHHPTPICRIPNLAIHMNRTVNDEGLKLSPHDHLPLQFGDEAPGMDALRAWLGEALGVAPERVRAWELGAVDTQAPTRYGRRQEFIAAPRLDNLASCHAGLEAMRHAQPDSGLAILAVFDHEEVGSESFKGAASSFLPDVLGRIARALDMPLERQLPRSWLLSADMTHARNPAFPWAYEEEDAPAVNAGPAVKINAKQRYASDAVGSAWFARLCEQAGVPCQHYVHRVDLPCGTTIGPMAATRLGVRTVDVGNPMWAMHSIREAAGAEDHAAMIAVLRTFYDEPGAADG